MKNSLLLLMILAGFFQAGAQSQLGLEQYYYFGQREDVALVTVGYYQNEKGWYGEARYNYEEKKTMSIYAGKTFYKEGKVSYAATPVLGLLVGQFHGGAVGGNVELASRKLILSTQIQYVFSSNDRTKNFLLTWSELGYQVFPFLKSGLAIQQSGVYHSAIEMEAGGFISLSYKNWQLPVYIFSPASDARNYVVGISWEWQHNTNNKNHGPVPSINKRRNLVVE